MATFTLDRPIDVDWRPSLAPWRAYRVALKASAGEILTVPNDLAFAAAFELAQWGHDVTWLDGPDTAEMEAQREIAQSNAPFPLSQAGVTTTRTLGEQTR